jgi:N-acetylglucosaminyldiphosphoundecaprenol N-acetyl-beta-D-mannosaminyltransferase
MSQTSRAGTRSDGARSGAAAAVRRREILGIPVAMVDYDGALAVMERMVEQREPGFVCVAPVMSLVVAQDDPLLRRALTEATLTVPDGMPVVWAANRLGERLSDRVYGPDLMDLHCRLAAERGRRIWLYGGRDEQALAELIEALERKHPGIDIAGGYSPPHREPTAAEDQAVAERINQARPDVVWVGIGVPKQEHWMLRMRPQLEAPVLCGVGAAFDFHAGRVSQAPAWMQRRGLEWAYRITQEPRRLLPRYLRTNPRFVVGVTRQYLRERRAPASP